MDESVILKELTNLFKRQGFSSIKVQPITPDLKWSFDLFAENKKEAVAIEIRKNDNIPQIFIDRIKAINTYKKKLNIFIVFDKKPRDSSISILKSLGLGVIIFKNNKLYPLFFSKDFSSKKSKKKKVTKKRKKRKTKDMHKITVFVSSKQYEPDKKTTLKERKKICKVIKDIQRRHEIPIFARLVENDIRDNKKFKRKITKNMKECHICICALNESYSEFIEHEFKKALQIIKNKKLILALKKEMKPIEIEPQQSKLIKYVEKHTSHVPYSSLTDFEDQLHSNLLKMIDLLYSKYGCKSPFMFKG